MKARSAHEEQELPLNPNRPLLPSMRGRISAGGAYGCTSQSPYPGRSDVPPLPLPGTGDSCFGQQVSIRTPQPPGVCSPGERTPAEDSHALAPQLKLVAP